MKHNNWILFLQRLVVVELEAILFILVMHLIYKWLSPSEIHISGVIWLQALFVLMASPLLYFSSKKAVSIWVLLVSALSILTGNWLGVDAFWLPIVLAIWRSITLINESDYLAATYNRMINIIVFLILYFVISDLYHVSMWWAIPLLVGGSFCFTIIGLAIHNLLEQISWNPNREEWKRIGRNQLIFILAMMLVMILLVAIRNNLIFLFTQIISVILRIITLLLAPLIILLSKVITFFYELLEEGNGKESHAQLQLSEVLTKVTVKDTSSDHNGIWIIISIVLFCCFFFILVKMIKNFDRKGKHNREQVEWTVISEQLEPNIRSNIFSFLKNINPFGKRQNIDQIRLHYIDFLKQYAQMRDGYPSNPTTRDMMKKASEEFSVNEEELQCLTRKYEDHRYGSKPTDIISVQEMKNAVENWLRK